MIKIIGIGLIAFIIYNAQLICYKKFWNKDLQVSVEFGENSLFEGDKGKLQEVITNRKHLPLPMLKVKFQTDKHLVFTDGENSRVTDQYYRNDVFQIGRGEKITRTLTFVGEKRGYYKINGIDIVAADLFLTKDFVQSISTKQYIYVFPKPYDSREFRLSLEKLNGEMITKRHMIEDPFEYRGIREYQPFDDMRSVNWKATAKTEELKVNQRNYTALQTIRVFFNIEDSGILKREASVEASLRIVAGLAEFFLMQGIRVACYGNGVDLVTSDVVSIEPSAGNGQMERIYKALARVDTAQDTASFGEAFRHKLMSEAKGTMNFFVSPNGYEDFLEVIREFRMLGEEFLWLFPTLEKEEESFMKEFGAHIQVVQV